MEKEPPGKGEGLDSRMENFTSSRSKFSPRDHLILCHPDPPLLAPPPTITGLFLFYYRYEASRCPYFLG